MSNLVRMMGIASMYAAIAKIHPLEQRKSIAIKEPVAEWERKKCKSCVSCGCYCYPYDYKGRIITKWSKPNYKACKMYSKKK